MNIGVENGDVNGGHCYMNSLTGSESRNQNSIYYRKKIDEISPKRSEVENNVLQDGVVIYVILPVPTLNQYANMEYNNKHHNLVNNSEIPKSNSSSVSTLPSHSVSSTNDKGCSLSNAIHENIKYSYEYKTQSRYVRRASDVIKSYMKLLARKTWHSVLLEYLLRYKAMEEVISEVDIITTSYTQYQIRQSKCQMRFLDNLLLK